RITIRSVPSTFRAVSTIDRIAVSRSPSSFHAATRTPITNSSSPSSGRAESGWECHEGTGDGTDPRGRVGPRNGRAAHDAHLRDRHVRVREREGGPGVQRGTVL